MDNPLLRLWKEENGEAYGTVGGRFINKRAVAAEKYSWAVPNEAALEEIAKHSPIIEIGTGLGYWASLLQEREVDIFPTDVCPARGKEKPWTSILEGGAEQLVVHKDRTLFMCWVPDYIAVQYSYVYIRNTILWVGEPIEFPGFKGNKMVEIPQWSGYNDALYVFKRRE